MTDIVENGPVIKISLNPLLKTVSYLAPLTIAASYITAEWTKEPTPLMGVLFPLAVAPPLLLNRSVFPNTKTLGTVVKGTIISAVTLAGCQFHYELAKKYYNDIVKRDAAASAFKMACDQTHGTVNFLEEGESSRICLRPNGTYMLMKKNL